MSIKYVSGILNGRIQIGESWLKEFSYASDAELVAIVKRLIAEGYAFVDEPAGWPPAAVLQDLHDKGMLDVPFTAIAWTAPDVYRTYEVPV